MNIKSYSTGCAERKATLTLGKKKVKNSRKHEVKNIEVKHFQWFAAPQMFCAPYHMMHLVTYATF